MAKLGEISPNDGKKFNDIMALRFFKHMMCDKSFLFSCLASSNCYASRMLSLQSAYIRNLIYAR